MPAGKQADWRAGRVDAHGFGATQNNDGKSPLKIGCYVKSFAARRSPSTLPASRFGPVPTAKHTHLDALRSRTVTPETLPRYTHKSYSVNILIRGNLWKKLPSMVSQSGPAFRSYFTIRRPLSSCLFGSGPVSGYPSTGSNRDRFP